MMTGKRILMILGGIYHDFDGFTRTIRPLLVREGHTVETTDDLDMLTRLEDTAYDLVLSYTSLSKHREGRGDTTPECLSDSQTSALAEWVSEGGALLGVHSATVSGQPNVAYRELLGARFLNHPPQFSFTVYPMAREHPITRGVEALTVRDEFYVQDATPSIQVHMVALDRGVAHPMVWSQPWGAGRVAYIGMGHGKAVWGHPSYQKLVLQAIEWLTEPEA